ncbi:MAG: hypothetical protein HYW48_02305 [Deltaproteobacteria bacterium]|nr:hypothetical protein [Deltaproteobacteria bacterium]
MHRFFLSLTLYFFLLSCTTISPTPRLGIQDAYRSYVPARTAVLPCQVWLSTSNFPAHPRSNVRDEDLKEPCRELDDYILLSFDAQPFMKGFTPKALGKFLVEAKKQSLMDVLASFFRYDPELCEDCQDIAMFYNESVKVRDEWRQWLRSFSEATHESDALLLPIFAFAWEDRENDRGLMLSKRALGVTLLLVDVETAQLIWVGGRRTTHSTQAFANATQGEFPEFPPWTKLWERILIEDLWRQYPGRIIL